MNDPYIPPATRRELGAPAKPGGRHKQMIKVASSLTGQRFSPEAIFAQLRGMNGPDVNDREIADVIRWASGKNFIPCTPRFTTRGLKSPVRTPSPPPDPAVNIRKFVGDFTAHEADLRDVSPWRPLENWCMDSLMFFAGMFHAGELVNVVTDYTVDENGKANPSGHGLTLERDAMMRHIRDKGTPQKKAGAWLRMNPIDGKGVSDANVTAFRFALLEIDEAPVELQLSLFARLPLPVNAILLSGGKSAHAIVRVNAGSADSYRKKVNELLLLLESFGTDQLNKNPSRLTRLPGAQREVGARGDGQQRLLYLAPDRTDSIPIFGE
jgi:hypothetical protein